MRVETDAATNLTGAYLWFARHRGQAVELDRGRTLSVGVPMTGARAVIAAVALDDRAGIFRQFGGVLRALSAGTHAESVRLVFEGHPPAGMRREQADALASEMLDAIAGHLAGDRIENVA